MVTGLSEARNAVIAVGKGHGTLAEVGFALKLGRPIASLSSWEVDPAVSAVGTPEAAIDYVGRCLGKG